MDIKESKIQIDDKFLRKFLSQKQYYNHCDIDLWINVTIIQLLNYNKLLNKKLYEFIQENKKYNYIEIREKINQEKLESTKKLINSHKENAEKSKKEKTNTKNSILGFEIPDCELYFIIKLFVDEIERKPHYQTKIIFTTENINQNIPFKFKYNHLTEDSYILIEIYSVELPPDKSFLGQSKIYLFDENLNLCQGRHISKISKPNSKNPNEQESYSDYEKELQVLINSFYGKELNNSSNYYGERKGLKIDSKTKIEEIENRKYYYNNEEKKPEFKTEEMINYDWKLNDLLSKTEESFIVVKLPSFNFQVIYEEGVSEDYKKIFKYGVNNTSNKKNKNPWIYDSCFFEEEEKDLTSKDNPLTEKFFILSKIDDCFAKEIKLNPIDRAIINQSLNKPDFELIKDNIFWNYRYELLRNDTHYSLTKIMNSVNWGNIKSENEFIQNILNKWKTIELGDILYMLSRKFSVNQIYKNDFGVTKLDGMKALRAFAVNKLRKYNIDELNFILLQLVQAIKYEDISIESYLSPLVLELIKKCKMNLNFASSFYWFIECEATSNNEENEISEIFKNIKQYFIEEIQNSMIFNIIENEIKFTEELKGITSYIKNLNKFEDPKKKLKEIINKDKKDFMYNNEHFLPIDPKIKIKGIDVDDCKIFTSTTKPIKYSFKITQETKQYCHFSEDSKYSKFFFKCGDDLRQDQLILQIINFMNSLLKKMQLDYKFTIYKVLATSNNEGFVEFVPKSLTYSKILNDYKKLELYFKEIAESQQDHQKYIDNYINSLAGYCAVNYILGIGDRHNENLMFDKNGKLFHIDFGFILNNDPKIYYKFKLTQDMVDLIGGTDSEKYKIFKQKCVNAYLILRDNARTIINMFYLMIDSGIPQLNIDQIKKLCQNFQLDLTKENAAKSFQDELDLTLNRVLPQILEMGHTLNQKWQNLF